MAKRETGLPLRCGSRVPSFALRLVFLVFLTFLTFSIVLTARPCLTLRGRIPLSLSQPSLSSPPLLLLLLPGPPVQRSPVSTPLASESASSQPDEPPELDVEPDELDASSSSPSSQPPRVEPSSSSSSTSSSSAVSQPFDAVDVVVPPHSSVFTVSSAGGSSS